jgi:hypothetical protein
MALTLQQGIEMYEALCRLPESHPYHGLHPQSFWASNQPTHGLEGEIHHTTPKTYLEMEREDWDHVHQGFDTIRIHFWANWGGNHHDGAPREDVVQVAIMLIDARHRWDGGMWYAVSGGAPCDLGSYPSSVELQSLAQVESALAAIVAADPGGPRCSGAKC